MSDSDGDQIPNYLETNSELDKYVAEVIPFNKIEGTLTFKLESKFETIKLSNEQDIARNAMKLLTKSLNTLRKEEYFSEWSLLIPERKSLAITDAKVSVVLKLDSDERPDYLTLTNGKDEYELGPFSSRMEFTLSGDELRQIVAGTLQLSLKRNSSKAPYSVESTIRERTYRVFYYDGRFSKIHYVSNELPFNSYLKLSGINESYDLKKFSGFSRVNPESFWWTRSVGEKDKIVVKSSLKDISAFHATNFVNNSTHLDRVNGTTGNSFVVKKVPGVAYVAKFRGTKVQKVIKESVRNYHIGGQAQDDCRQWIRSVISATTVAITKEDLLSSLVIQSKEKSVNLKDMSTNLTEGVDEKGWYLELALNETPEEFTFLLSSRPQSSFVMTGIYRDSCYGARDLVNTNDEGQMNLNIESFIEKID